MISRRSFVGGVLAGAAGGLVLAEQAIAKTLLAGRKINKIGLQLYTVRKEMEKDFEGTLSRVAALGYKEVEFAGYYNREPKQVKALLKSNGLDAPSAHLLLSVLREGLPRTIEVAQTIGHRYLILAYLFPNERKTLEDYKKLPDLLNRAGEECKKAGIQFGYHNHDFEFETLDGQVPYDLLLKETDANLVKMELDLYWITKARQQPEKYFDMYPGRFPLLHVKDMDRTPAGQFTEVGRGVIDFKRVFAQSAKAGVKHYFVEQDESPGSPFDSIKISYDYLRGLRF